MTMERYRQLISVLNLLRRGRDRIALAENWRAGLKDDGTDEATLSYCAGSALYDRDDPRDDQVYAEAVRCLLRAADRLPPEPRSEDDELNALIVWNDSSDHAAVLAAYDRAIIRLKIEINSGYGALTRSKREE